MTEKKQDISKIDVRDRRLVLIASPKATDKITEHIDWDLIGDILLATSKTFTPWGILLPERILVKGLNQLIKSKRLPYPVFNIKKARDKFNFPINHPIDGTMYACCDAEPNLYVPLAHFHNHMLQAKLNAFHTMCANLGAKRVSSVYEEENGKILTSKIGATDVPTQGGPVSAELNTRQSSKSYVSGLIDIEYFEPESAPFATNTIWMNSESTWTGLQHKRLTNKNIKHLKAEFNYLDEMGVNAEVSTKIANAGFSIGGTYEEMKKIKMVLDVEFWPISKK